MKLTSHVSGLIDRHLTGSMEVRRILANTGWLVSGQTIRIVVGFLVNVVVTRYLGPTQYGALALAIAFAALFAPLIRLGLDKIVIRDLVSDARHRQAILGTTFALKLAAGVLLLPVIVLAAMVVYPGDTLMMGLTLLASAGLILSAFDAIDLWFQAQVRSKYTVYARLGSFSLVSAARLIGVGLGAPLLVFAVIGLLETVAYAAGQVITIYRAGQPIHRWRVDGAIARRLLRESWPLILSGLAVVLYMRIDQTMLGAMLPGDAGKRAAGIYAVAVQLSEMWYFIPTAIVNSAFPAVVQARQSSPTLYEARLQRLFNLLALLSYAIAIPMTFLSGVVIRIYGADYQEAGPMLAILMWAGLWVSLGLVREAAIQAESKLVYSMLSTLVGAAVNVAANLVLIPALAGLGAAIATTVSYGASAYLTSLLFPPLRQLGRMQTRALLYPDPRIKAHGQPEAAQE